MNALRGTSCVLKTGKAMRELALFAGAGGGILGGHQLGWRTVCAVEWEPYAACVLAARQNDGFLQTFPIWSDIQTFDGRAWRGAVDVVSGGFPCQDISVAGKGAGIDGKQSGMWGHMARIIGEVRPRYCFVENVPAILTRGLGRVLSDLAALGYDCRWTVLGAADVGAPHQRDRFWLVATDALHGGHGLDVQSQRLAERGAAADVGRDGAALAVAHGDGERQLQPQGCQREEWRRPCDRGGELADTDRKGLAQRQGEPSDTRQEQQAIERADWWLAEPDVGRVVDGVAHRVDRLKALGNGQVPRCAAEAWRLLI